MREIVKPSCILFGIAVYAIVSRWLINVDTILDYIVTFALFFAPSYVLAFDLDEIFQ